MLLPRAITLAVAAALARRLLIFSGERVGSTSTKPSWEPMVTGAATGAGAAGAAAGAGSAASGA